MRITWIQPYYDIILNHVPLDTESIIDVGSGYGIFGYILSRARKLKSLISVEPFGYDTTHYNSNYKMTWQEFHETNSMNVDVIVSTEMIEHLDYSDAIYFLKQAKEKAKTVIIATPFVFEEQCPYDGNQYQVHRCAISVSDFQSHGYTVNFLSVVNFRGLNIRLYYHLKWNKILKVFRIKPTNIIGVWKK